MNPRDILRILDPRGWAMLAGGAALLIIIIFMLGKCTRDDDLRKANTDRAMADARTASASEAITEMGELQDRGLATDSHVEEAQNAVRQADPADRDRIARYELCRLQHRPDCDRL